MPIQWPGKITMPMGGADREDFAKRWEETFRPKPELVCSHCGIRWVLGCECVDACAVPREEARDGK